MTDLRRVLPTDDQVTAARKRITRHGDADRATTIALGEMEGLTWALAIYLDERPELADANPDLVTAVQRMLAVGRAWDEEYGLTAATRRRSTETAFGEQVEAWLAARPPVVPGDDDRPGWW